MKNNEIKFLIEERLKNNKGKILSNIKIGDYYYDVVPFKNDESGLNSIISLYGDSYMNYMFVPYIPMIEENFIKKLNKVINDGLNDGITLWQIIRKNDSALVGLFGFTYFDLEKNKIEISYGSKVGGIVTGVCEEMISFAFEYLKFDCFLGRCLSYNYFSQLIGKSIGMKEDSVEICKDDYIKDSYLTRFKFTKDDYEEIKNKNGGKYKVFNLSKRNTEVKQLHDKARNLSEVLEEFSINKESERYKYCENIKKYLEERYPIIYKKDVFKKI
ncbi:MAG TPA: GNAT family protein [Rickettsiales bacterium]|nr:GNAT family protein [Rickettsiales bacterium]